MSTLTMKIRNIIRPMPSTSRTNYRHAREIPITGEGDLKNVVPLNSVGAGSIDIKTNAKAPDLIARKAGNDTCYPHMLAFQLKEGTIGNKGWESDAATGG